MTWSSDVPPSHRAVAANPPGAVRWSPDELLPETHAPGAVHPELPGDASPLAQQQALDDAFTQGFDAGREAGAAGERARLETTITAVHDLLAQLRERETRWTERVEENICALAVAVGRQLFDRELAAAPSLAGDLVRRALAEFPIDQAVSIRVNPADLASITAFALANGAQPPTLGRADAQWVPDPRITPGGCVIEGRDRIIDGRVDTALERLYRRLTGTGG